MKLSIVIPAYNEERRLPRTLDKMISYVFQYFKEGYEIIIVDDGSWDNTVEIVDSFKKRFQYIRLVKMVKNQGRGAAVREGIKEARGEIILETDADGSVEEEAIFRFYDFLNKNKDVDVVIGSRNIAGAEILTPQPFLRVFLGYGFLYLAKLLFYWRICDYTLGFKMFRRKAAEDIFAHQLDNRYVAEAEIVVVSKKRNWRLEELPVLWTDFRESRVHPLRDSWRSFLGLIRIFLNYGF